MARKVRRDTVFMGPAVECFRDELRPVVDLDRAWCSAQESQVADDSHDLLAFDAPVDLDCQCLSRERICGRLLLSSRATASRLNFGVNSRLVFALKYLPRP